MIYRVDIAPRAQRQIDRLQPRLRERALHAIHGLAIDPRPPGCRKLTGRDARWRVRVGDYRVVYTIFDDSLLVEIVEVGPRDKVYR
ncbi:MAG: type II toxin-antitoxin system RelE/ParE family toxin [Dehalococcoidia bacterium]